MLPLRFAIFASLAAICLWGLFSLLENLREPELLRSPKVVVVKGCEPIETDNAARTCPQLFCQKAILDAKLMPLRAQFQTTVQRRGEDQVLIAGIAAAPSSQRHFACILENNKVSAARLLEPAEFEALSAEPDDWSL